MCLITVLFSANDCFLPSTCSMLSTMCQTFTLMNFSWSCKRCLGSVQIHQLYGEPWNKQDIQWRRYVGTFVKFLYILILCKLSRITIERSAEKRSAFAARIGTYEAEQLVFVDKSTVDRHTTYRGRAWAIRGMKATRKAFFVHRRRLVDTLDM